MTTAAGDLVRSFGDIATMESMYGDDITWTLPTSLGPAAGPHVGKAAVVAFNHLAWGTLYEVHGVEVDIHAEIEEGDISSAHFTYRAIVKPSGEPYENDYMIFVRSHNGRIVAVWEYTDTLKVAHYEGLRPMLPPLPQCTSSGWSPKPRSLVVRRGGDL